MRHGVMYSCWPFVFFSLLRDRLHSMSEYSHFHGTNASVCMNACVCVYMYLVPRESPPLVVMLPRLFSFPFYVPLLVVCVHWREQGRCTGAGEGRRKGVGLGENNNNNKPASQPADKGTHGVNEEGGDRLGLLSEKKKREPRRREYGVHPHTHPTHRHTRALQKKALPNESATACVRCARKSARAMEEGSGERRLKAWTITKE